MGLVGGTLAGLESIYLTTSGSGTIAVGTPGTPGTYATTQALSAADFTNGKKLIWLKDPASAAETISLTATGSGGLSSNVTVTKTLLFLLGPVQLLST